MPKETQLLFSRLTCGQLLAVGTKLHHTASVASLRFEVIISEKDGVQLGRGKAGRQ